MGIVSREPYEPQDVLIVFKDDMTADIAPVMSINDERIYAESNNGDYSIPVGDVRSYTGRKGRIFLYPSSVENVTDCQRIAALEKSTVLRQITHFADDAPIQQKPMNKMVLFAIAAIVLIIILVVK